MSFWQHKLESVDNKERKTKDMKLGVGLGGAWSRNGEYDQSLHARNPLQTEECYFFLN